MHSSIVIPCALFCNISDKVCCATANVGHTRFLSIVNSRFSILIVAVVFCVVSMFGLSLLQSYGYKWYKLQILHDTILLLYDCISSTLCWEYQDLCRLPWFCKTSQVLQSCWLSYCLCWILIVVKIVKHVLSTSVSNLQVIDYGTSDYIGVFVWWIIYFLFYICPNPLYIVFTIAK